MNLKNKKELAARVLGVGKNRIIFNPEGLTEIKEAVTKQDIRDLFNEGIISIKPKKGRRKIKKRKNKRGPGKIKKKVNKRKQRYVKLTRKLRKYLKALKLAGKIDRKTYWDIRKKIKIKAFKSKAHLKEYIENLNIKKITSEKITKKGRTTKKKLVGGKKK